MAAFFSSFRTGTYYTPQSTHTCSERKRIDIATLWIFFPVKENEEWCEQIPVLSSEKETFTGPRHFFTNNAVPAYLESDRDHQTR